MELLDTVFKSFARKRKASIFDYKGPINWTIAILV